MKQIRTGQQGMAFAITLIVVAVAALLSIPVMALTSSVLHRSAATRTTLDEQYSVDGGNEDAIWRLQNDPSYLNDILQTVPAPTYAITVNGQPVNIEAEPVSPPSAPPTTMPTPTPNPGIEPLMWTTIYPPQIEYLNPPATVNLTISIQDSPSSTAPIISQMVEVLPANFTYVPGSLECDGDPVQCSNLVWKTSGLPVQVADLEDPLVMTVEDPMFPTTRVPNPDPPNPGELPDPWDPSAVANSCPPDTTRADDDTPQFTQRLEWQWNDPNVRPKVVDGTTATISFDATVPNPLDLSTLPLADNPWIESSQNQCNQGGSEQFQAGKPFALRVTFTALITSTQGDTSLKSLVQFVLPSPIVEIKSQRYGQ